MSALLIVYLAFGLSKDQSASLCALRVTQAVQQSQVPLAAKIAARGEFQLIDRRFKKPDACKLGFADHSIWLELRWRGKFTRFYSIGQVDSHFVLPLATTAKTSKQSNQYCRNRPEIAKLAIKQGMDAVICRGRVIFLPKYFRQGQNETDFRQALKRTLANDLGADIDLEAEVAEAQLRADEYALGLRAKLAKLPICRRRAVRYDIHYFPLEIQRGINEAIRLYWIAAEWRFLQSLPPLVGGIFLLQFKS